MAVLKTLLAGPHGVLQPGEYDEATLSRYGYETAALVQPETTVAPRPRVAVDVIHLGVVTRVQAEKLAEAGVVSAIDVIQADEKTLTSVRGIGPATARKLKKAAQRVR